MSGLRVKLSLPLNIFTILILISQVTIIPCFAQGIVHENPETVTPEDRFSNENELQIQLAVFIYSSNYIVRSINVQDYAQSKLEFVTNRNSYDNYKEFLLESDEQLSSDIYYKIDPSLANCQKDLEIWVRDSEAYDKNYQYFNKYTSAEDIINATPYAIQVKNSYKNLSNARSSYSTNAMLVAQMLEKTWIQTQYLNKTVSLMDDHLNNLKDDEKAIDDFLGRTNLSLTADRDVAQTGDTITFSISLKTYGSVPVGGKNVNLYINEQLVGTNTLNYDGIGTFLYVIPGDTTNRLDVIAEFPPQDPWLVPVNSSKLVLPVKEKNTTLSMYIPTTTFTYGDVVEIGGRLQAIDGFAVPNRRISISINDRIVGNTITTDDGSYRYLYPITDQTPCGTCTISAAYTREAATGDIFLSSPQAVISVLVNTQETLLTFVSSHNSLIGGDSNEFYGRLTTTSGMPVKSAVVKIFDGRHQLVSNTTDQDGNYHAHWVVPVDYFDGQDRDHSLYASFITDSKSLNGTSSGEKKVSFGETMPTISGNIGSTTLFVNDVFYIYGSLRNGNDNPLVGQPLSIIMSNETIAEVTTDARGNYGYMRRITMRDQLGQHLIAVSSADITYSAGNVLIIPFNKIVLLFISGVISLLLAYIFIKITGLNRLIYLRIRRGRPATLKKKQYLKPVCINTSVPMPVALAEAINIETETAEINRLIESKDIKKALLRIYFVIKKMAIHKGIDVTGSMTHREIYRLITAKYASIAKPLWMIIGEYEVVNFANAKPDEADVERTIKSLNDVYEGVSSQAGEDPSP